MSSKSYVFVIRQDFYLQNKSLLEKYNDGMSNNFIIVRMTFEDILKINSEIVPNKIMISITDYIFSYFQEQDELTITRFINTYLKEIADYIYEELRLNSSYRTTIQMLRLSSKQNYYLTIFRRIKTDHPQDTYVSFVSFKFLSYMFKYSVSDHFQELLIELSSCIFYVSSQSFETFLSDTPIVCDIISKGILNDNFHMLKYIYTNVFSTYANYIHILYEYLYLCSIFHDKYDFYERICQDKIVKLTPNSHDVIGYLVDTYDENLKDFIDFCFRLVDQDIVEIDCGISKIVNFMLKIGTSEMVELFTYVATIFPIEVETLFVEDAIQYYSTYAKEKIYDKPNKDEIIDMIIQSNRLSSKVNDLMRNPDLHQLFYDIILEVRRENRELMEMES